MKYLFYSIIGKHGGESVQEILSRKNDEIVKCGWGLWSAKIDKKSVELVWNLSKEDTVEVLCKVNEKAKDPVVIEGTNAYRAIRLIGPDGDEQVIPEGINTTFTKGKNYQAYVVKRYEILEKPVAFDFGKYETIQADGIPKSFTERFKCSQFQNTFGRLNSELTESCCKDISVKMILEYPFVVNLK